MTVTQAQEWNRALDTLHRICREQHGCMNCPQFRNGDRPLGCCPVLQNDLKYADQPLQWDNTGV